jgi:PAS domain S-box-containing protein
MKTSSPHVLIRWSADVDGRITFFNNDWELYTGLEKSAVYGSAEKWIDAVHPEDRAQVRGLIATPTSRGRAVRFRLLGKDGIYRTFEGVAVNSERDASWAGFCELAL